MMKQIATILLVVGCTFSAIADKVPSELKTLQSLRAKKIKEIDDAYIKSLEKLKVTYTKRGDLESANAVVAAIQQVKGDTAIADKQPDKTTPLLAANSSLKLNEGILYLGPKQAQFKGRLRYEEEINAITFWNQPEDKIVFNVPDLEEGKYKLTIEHATKEGGVGKLSIQLNDHEIEEKFESTGGWLNPKKSSLGYYRHSGGPLIITLSILEQNAQQWPVINYYSMTLEKK